MLRALIKTADELITLGYDPTQEVEQVIDIAEKKIFQVMQKKNQKGYSSIKDILVDTFTQLEQLYNQKNQLQAFQQDLWIWTIELQDYTIQT